MTGTGNVRFLIDESLPPQLAEGLRVLGREASHVQDHNLSGADDDTIYATAAKDGSILVSQDLDFSDLRRFHNNVGLLIVRFRHPLTRDEVVRRCLTAIQVFATEIEALGSNIMILEPGRRRIRRRSP